ncbi:glucokinase [Mortierella hygrophila]|uniref:Phosphotransferase n=1 Tax=Mortierella hygrophila TaxID=979708 RepID=A0A9P6K168_9FUNG|nr:glucokinase [Mortierella hygrophila]
MLTSSTPAKPHTKWSDKQSKALADLTEEFTLSTAQLEHLTAAFIDQMQSGLAGDHKSSDLAMIPTFVSGRLDGQERGSYLALDLGGTNFRVCLITLKGNHDVEPNSESFKVTEHLQEAHISELMDFIAISIKDFITREHISSKIAKHRSNSNTLELGFTFSFPVTQTAIDAGMLLRWTKGFNCPGAVGSDIVQLLQEALDRKEVKVHVAALVNDTVGTLLAHSYKYPNTFIGAIFGTGTNGAYVEATRSIKTMPTPTAKEMIINIEWGNFDKDKRFLPVTPFDNKLDRESINPGVHVFEKMISGMYLGEITRNILLHLIDRRLLFDGTSSQKLNAHWSFKTEFMSQIESDTSPNLTSIAQILKQKLEICSKAQIDREIVKAVCELVGKRAARLSAMATAAVVRKGLSDGGHLAGDGYPLKLSEKHRVFDTAAGVNKSETAVEKVHERTDSAVVHDGNLIHVGIDGSVFKLYPHFEERMVEGLTELLGSRAKDLVPLNIAEDGSGVGAALAALIATKNAVHSR